MDKAIFQISINQQEEYIYQRTILSQFKIMKSMALASNINSNRKNSRINILSSDLGLVIANRTLGQVKLYFSKLRKQRFRIHFSLALNSLQYYLPRILIQLTQLFRSKPDQSYLSSLDLQRDQQFIEVKMKNYKQDKLFCPTTIKRIKII